MARVHIVGLDALRESLKEFPKALQERAVNKGVRKAAATLRTAMRRGAYAAPLAKGYKRTNKLRNSLRSAVARKPQFRGKAWVGLKRIPGNQRPLSYYKVLEKGRKPYTRRGRTAAHIAALSKRQRRRGAGSAVAGSFPMRPFFNRTWLANRARVGAILVEETKKALAYEAGKAYGRSKGKR
jgi:hypothetical protein